MCVWGGECLSVACMGGYTHSILVQPVPPDLICTLTDLQIEE